MLHSRLLVWSLLLGALGALEATSCYQGLDSLAPFRCIEDACPTNFMCEPVSHQCVSCPGASGGLGTCATLDGGSPDATHGGTGTGSGTGSRSGSGTGTSTNSTKTFTGSGSGDFSVVTECDSTTSSSVCRCPDGTAISGGANAGAGNMLSSSLSGQVSGEGTASWTVACVTSTGESVTCDQPFVVCATSGFPVEVEEPSTSSGGDDALDSMCGSGAAISGGASAGQGEMLNAMQVGASFGEDEPVWRVSAVNSQGTRIVPFDTFVVCTDVEPTPTLTLGSECSSSLEETLCTCPDGEIAISGGAFAGSTSSMLNSSQAGPAFGGSLSTWRLSCVTPGGSPTECEDAFAICVEPSGLIAIGDAGVDDGGFGDDGGTDSEFVGTWILSSSNLTINCGSGSNGGAAPSSLTIADDGNGEVTISAQNCSFPATVSSNEATVISGSECNLGSASETVQSGTFTVNGESGTLTLLASESEGEESCTLEGSATYTLESH